MSTSTASPSAAELHELRTWHDADGVHAACSCGWGKTLGKRLAHERLASCATEHRARSGVAIRRRTGSNTSKAARTYVGQTAAADGWRCSYCRHVIAPELMTVDHIVPMSRGGTNESSNLTHACSPCNGLKGNLTLDEWIESCYPARSTAVPVAFLPRTPRLNPLMRLAFEAAGFGVK